MKKIFLICVSLVVLLWSVFVGCDAQQGTNSTGGNSKTDVQQSIINYTISFDTNGGTSVSAQRGTKLMSAPKTTRENFEFQGWFLDKTLTQAVVYPLTVKNDTTLYAKWLRTAATIKCQNISIKLNWNLDNMYSVAITPNGFDMDTLASLGYYMLIDVSYKVYYKKDYDVLWDIGYMGAPKYEISIVNSDDRGRIETDVVAPSKSTSRSISYEHSVADMRNEKFRLVIHTDNIQNIIYFTDIVVTYRCTRYQL